MPIKPWSDESKTFEYVNDGPLTPNEIADMACYPWVLAERQQQDIADFLYLRRWKEAIAERPAVQRAYALAKAVNPQPTSPTDPVQRKILFGQDKDTVR